MAFHPVLSIRYVDEEPMQKVTSTRSTTKQSRTPITDLAREIVWSTIKFFNSVVNFLSGRPHDPEDFPYEYSSSTEEETVTKEVPENRKLLNQSLSRLAVLLASTHRRNLLRTQGPPGSLPGEYPHWRTKNLANSIGSKMAGKGKKSFAQVGYNDKKRGKTGNPAEYSQVLAARGRLSIPATARAFFASDDKTDMGYIVEWRHDGGSN